METNSSFEKRTANFLSLSKIKDIVGIVVPILGLCTLMFAYFNYRQYVSDPSRIPSLDVDCKMEKVSETGSHYIVKLSFDIRCKSKRKVEVVSNYCVLLGRGDSLNNWTDKEFYAKTKAELDNSIDFGFYPIELNKSFGNIDRVIGF